MRVAITGGTGFVGRHCDAVAHCAGINREIGAQTCRRVHIEGTQNVVDAARQADVRKIVLLSFLRARPNCGSAYHESIRPLAVEDLVTAILVSIQDARLSNKTISVTGPEEIALGEAVCRVGQVGVI